MWRRFEARDDDSDPAVRGVRDALGWVLGYTGDSTLTDYIEE